MIMIASFGNRVKTTAMQGVAFRNAFDW